MLFWHQKIWLGDGNKPGQSVYWDTKEKKAYLGESSKLISAKKSKNNGLCAGMVIVILLGVIGLLRACGVHIQVTSETESGDVWMSVLALVYSVIFIYLMNRFFYHRHAKYTETTLKRAKAAIKTHPFYGAGKIDLFIFLPIMYLICGAFGVEAVYISIETLVTDLKWRLFLHL